MCRSQLCEKKNCNTIEMPFMQVYKYIKQPLSIGPKGVISQVRDESMSGRAGTGHSEMIRGRRGAGSGGARGA